MIIYFCKFCFSEKITMVRFAGFEFPPASPTSKTMVCLVTVWHWQPPTPDASNHLPVVRGALPSWKMSGRLSPQLHRVWQFGCNLGHVIYQRPAAIPKLRKFESLESALDGQMVNLNVHLWFKSTYVCAANEASVWTLNIFDGHPCIYRR